MPLIILFFISSLASAADIDPSVIKQILQYKAQATPSTAWLEKHLGEGANQIPRLVLTRARDLYQHKKKVKLTSNPCYVAMDATRPHHTADGKVANRAFLICESLQIFVPFESTHGSGRKIPAVTDASNSRKCAGNFGNVLGSNLTTGGAYVTGAITNTYKGEIEKPNGTHTPFFRRFLEFSGEGATANARECDVGAHAATLLSGGCYRHEPNNPLAKYNKGYVYYAPQAASYLQGRTQGCMGTTDQVANSLLTIADGKPMTVYIYPEARDIRAVAKAVAENKPLGNLYWNRECLNDIKTPQYWDRETHQQAFIEAKTPAPETPKKLCGAVATGTPLPPATR